MSDLFWGGVTGVVITLSPHLLDTQEGALAVAAAVWGLELLQITHEPIGAVLAYTAR